MKLSVRIRRPAEIVAWLLVTFLVLFPKGGFRLAGAPLTWGYMLLGLIAFPLLLVRILQFPLTRVSRLGFLAAASVVPFQLIFCYTGWQQGILDLNYAVAIGTGFLFLPVVFFLILPAFLPLIEPQRFKRHFCFCIFAAAVWGILMFFYHPIMHKFIEIPYLTVNAGDYGLLETTKHINRGAYLKLISTYNNGNLYGVATLILLPLYLRLEPKPWKRNTVRVALTLTLSRTVWLGLLLEQGLTLVAGLGPVFARFPKIRPGRTLRQLLLILATFCLVLVGLLFNGNGLGFLKPSTDNLGARTSEFEYFLHPTLLPSMPLTTFDEVLYASALRNYGVIGFFTVVLIFFFPMFLMAQYPALTSTPSRRAAAKGLVIYALVAFIDGATVLIPVMAFYWFTYMTMLYGLPGEQPLTHAGRAVRLLPGAPRSAPRYGLASASTATPATPPFATRS
jgi:hypothetical protein